MAKQIGIYGGTFDPLHFGHLNLAIEILEKKNLDEVWLCPARVSPHKQEDNPTPIEHRVKMLEKVVAGTPNLRLCTLESERQGPSYTVDTINFLIQKYPKDQFYWMMGEDSIPGFFSWKNPAEIVRLVPLLIGGRSLKAPSLPEKGDPAICKAIQEGLVKTRVLEISATEVRERLRRRLFCGHLVPKEILDYINSHDLYFNDL